MRVGTLVHHEITGQPVNDIKGIAFDDLTPGHHKMKAQVIGMKNAVERWLEAGKYEILHQEMPLGVDFTEADADVRCTTTLDLVLKHPDDEIAIVNLKTARTTRISPNAYAQAAIECAVARNARPSPFARTPTEYAFLVVNRNTFPTAKAIWLDMDELVSAGLEMQRSLGKMAARDEWLRSPGQHCGRCNVTECHFNQIHNTHIYEKEQS